MLVFDNLRNCLLCRLHPEETGGTHDHRNSLRDLDVDHVLLFCWDLCISLTLRQQHLTICQIRLEHGENTILEQIARGTGTSDCLFNLGGSLHTLHHLGGLIDHACNRLQHQTSDTLSGSLHKSEETICLGSLDSVLVDACHALLETVENASLTSRTTILVILTHGQRRETISERACNLTHSIDQTVGRI